MIVERMREQQKKRNRNKLNCYLNWKITVTPPPLVQEILLYCGAASAIELPAKTTMMTKKSGLGSPFPVPPSIDHRASSTQGTEPSSSSLLPTSVQRLLHIVVVIPQVSLCREGVKRNWGNTAKRMMGSIQNFRSPSAEADCLCMLSGMNKNPSKNKTWRRRRILGNLISISRIISVSFVVIVCGSLTLLINGSME